VFSLGNGLWCTLKNEFFPDMTEERWQEIADAFRKCSHFPNCLGAIKGEHIRVTKFSRSGSVNLNYKCYFFTVLTAIADSDYKFTYVHIGLTEKSAICLFFRKPPFLSY